MTDISQAFKFSFKNRASAPIIDELGRTLLNLCNITPGGIVCFLPSYAYEAVVVRYQFDSKIHQNEQPELFLAVKHKQTVDYLPPNRHSQFVDYFQIDHFHSGLDQFAKEYC